MKKRKILAAAIGLAMCVVTWRGAIAQQHGSQPDTPHHGDPESADQAGTHVPEAKGHDPHHPIGRDDHHGPAPINWTDLGDTHRPAFIALLVNFGLLVGLYYTLGKKPIAEGLKQRRVTIGKDIEEAKKMLAEASERAEKYQADLKNADADAATAKAGLVASAKGEVEHVLSEAAERAERMKRDADRLIDQERKQLRQDLLMETIDRSVTEAEKLLQNSTTAEDHARLADDLLGELAKIPAARGAAAPRPMGGA
jgi:F-type H+-transporting ATPase subunit b